jgi:hypothetical protein
VTASADKTALGSAFIMLADPYPGHEHAYNRWYEDDHFGSIAGMALPWWFAGRRWVATRALRELREPADAPAIPLDNGCYLGTFWTTAGRHADQWRALGAAVTRLRADERMFAERQHVHAAFYDFTGSARRDRPGPTEIHALDYPYRGLVLELLDAPRPRDAVLAELLADALPAAIAGSPIGLCVTFTPHPRPPTDELWFDSPEADPGRILLAWFTDTDPRSDWRAIHAARAAAVTCSGATSRFVAPFIPTIPGTDTYVDELR